MMRSADRRSACPAMRRWLRTLALFALLFSALTCAASPALAVSPAPGWTIHSLAVPSSFSGNDTAECLHSIANRIPLCDGYHVTVTNAGSMAANGSAIKIKDVLPTLPTNLTVRKISLFWSGLPGAGAGEDIGGFLCNVATVECSLATSEFGLPPVGPDDTLEMDVYVTVDDPSATGEASNRATVSGGGAAEVATEGQNTVGSATPPAFGATSFSSFTAAADGTPDLQAGDHPYELTTRIDLASEFRIGPSSAFKATSVGDVKDVVIDLPLGFVGSALAAPTCTLAQLSSSGSGSGCPQSSRVGHIVTHPDDGLTNVNSPIYNVAPEHGVAAEFGFIDGLKTSHVLYARVVPSPAGYVLRVTAREIPQVALTDVVTTFYGDPAAKDGIGNPVAMFTNPTECSGKSLVTSLYVDSWQNPGRLNADGSPDLSDPSWRRSESESPPVTGCNRLQFAPSLTMQPTTSAADSPSGLAFDLRVPQFETPGQLATPALRRTSVTLPAGFVLNASSANGLQACSPDQIGWLGGGLTHFTAAEPTCPDASKVGTVTLTTPLLARKLSGSVYLASQNDNPTHSVLAAYIVIDDPASGIVIKLPGELSADPETGQITGTFAETPQLPFEELELHFKGSTDGVLATPEGCGTFTASSAFSSWSAPSGSGPDAGLLSSLQIESACAFGFTPSFTAGVTNTQAGAYSPLVLSFSRTDGEQELAGLSLSLPDGLLAKVAGVPRCSDAALAHAAASSGAAERATPSCPARSQVGTVQTVVGVGPDALPVAGAAYLGGSYEGAPFSLAIVVPALAGPFDLGTVVVRSALRIDPHDAHVSVVSDPFPTILDAPGVEPPRTATGFPLRLRRVDVTLDKAAFTFNPTDCAPAAFAGALRSTGGAMAAVSSRFQVGGCSELPFHPSLTASTQGSTSKANGASLTVKIRQIPGEANIRKVGLQLPLALPSRLTTLQKACPDAQFAVDPAGCPAASNVGTATAVTPALNVPLSGPAYLVSHGSAAFPDLEFVLQGEGVTIVLDGKTRITRGITFSTFSTVPDAPISTFEAKLPEGAHSVLAANGSLCVSVKRILVRERVTRRIHGRVHHLVRVRVRHIPAPLLMPTTIAGQNGAVMSRVTTIGITGCHRPTVRRTHR